MLIQDIFTIFAVSMSSSLSYKPVASSEGLDPVFARFGQRVWSYDKIEEIRAENVRHIEKNEEILRLAPQKGMRGNLAGKPAKLRRQSRAGRISRSGLYNVQPLTIYAKGSYTRQ